MKMSTDHGRVFFYAKKNKKAPRDWEHHRLGERSLRTETYMTSIGNQCAQDACMEERQHWDRNKPPEDLLFGCGCGLKEILVGLCEGDNIANREVEGESG